MAWLVGLSVSDKGRLGVSRSNTSLTVLPPGRCTSCMLHQTHVRNSSCVKKMFLWFHRQGHFLNPMNITVTFLFCEHFMMVLLLRWKLYKLVRKQRRNLHIRSMSPGSVISQEVCVFLCLLQCCIIHDFAWYSCIQHRVAANLIGLGRGYKGLLQNFRKEKQLSPAAALQGSRSHLAAAAPEKGSDATGSSKCKRSHFYENWVIGIIRSRHFPFFRFGDCTGLGRQIADFVMFLFFRLECVAAMLEISCPFWYDVVSRSRLH